MVSRKAVPHCQWEIKRVPPPNLPRRLSRSFLANINKNRQIKQILRKGITTLGRAPNNTITSSDSVLTSRRHCSIILKDDGSIFIVDHKSLNGTFLQGKSILPNRETALDNGDIIGLGIETTIEELDANHPPKEHYIFKITRKILSKDELETQDPNTVVPILDGSYKIYNYPENSTIDVPSTSHEGALEKGLHKEDKVQVNLSKLVECSNDVQKDAEMDIVDLVDSSDDEGDANKSIKETKPADVLDVPDTKKSVKENEPDDVIVVLDEWKADEVNKSDDNVVVSEQQPDKSPSIITIDCETDSNGPKPLENALSENKTNDLKTRVEDFGNCDISDHDLMQIKEVETAFDDMIKVDVSLEKNKEKSSGNNSGIEVDVSLEKNKEKSSGNNSGISKSAMENNSGSLDTVVDTDKTDTDVVNEKLCKSNNAPPVIQEKSGGVVEGIENKNQDHGLEIKEEKTLLADQYSTNDDIIFIEDDDDGELPCSQLFDDTGFQDTNNEIDIERTVDDGKTEDIESWQVDDDSDSDSDTEKWFLRLSQSYDRIDTEEEEEEAKEKDHNDKHSRCDSIDGDVPVKPFTEEKPDDQEVIEKSGDLVQIHSASENKFEEHGPYDSEDSDHLSARPIFRKVIGSKRKLSESSDEELQMKHETVLDTTQSCDKNDSKLNKHSFEKLIPGMGDEFSRTLTEKQKKSDKLPQKSLEETPFLDVRQSSLKKSDDSDDSDKEIPRKKYLKSDKADKSSISGKSKEGKHQKNKIRHKRKHSIDSNSSKSSDICIQNRQLIRNEVHDKESSEDSIEVEWQTRLLGIINEFGTFVELHEKKRPKPAFKDHHHRKRVSTEIEDEYVDEEDEIKPSKIMKLSEQHLNSEKNENSLNKAIYLEKHDKYKKSTVPASKSCEDQTASKLVVKSAKAVGFEGSVMKTTLNTKSMETTKLSEVSKKINASYKKKVPEIIEPQAIRAKRKSFASESENCLKKDGQVTENKQEQWLSNNKGSKINSQTLSKADTKALRKERLKDLAMKETQENRHHEKPKTFTAKNKTKTTTTSRNDMFLQDLVSSDSGVVEKNDKVMKDANLLSYKIPRRPSGTEDRIPPTNQPSTTQSKPIEVTHVPPTLPAAQEPKMIVEPKLQKTLQHSSMESSSKLISDKEKKSKPLLSTSSASSNISLLDKILKNSEAKSMNNKKEEKKIVTENKPQVKTSVVGVENEEPDKVVYLREEEYQKQFPGNTLSKQKSIIKQSLTPRKSKKRLRFNFLNDDKNVVYVSIREFEVDEENKLKPVTKSVSKEKDSNIKAKKPSLRKSESSQFINYKDETLYIICNWNCAWFEEKVNIQKDPPVFPGQMYHLTGEFSDYNDYRRGIFPLLIYELWGTVSKQYDLVKLNTKTNPIYNIDIRGSKIVKVSNIFVQTRRSPSLQHLVCQVVLDKKQQDAWPRPGDLVVLSLTFKEDQRMGRDGKLEVLKGGERRIFGYVSDCPPPKKIETHPDVCPRLREQSPNAKMVTDSLNIIIRGDRGQQIDTKAGAKFKVLKNIRSDLRSIDALDYLPISPLSQQIFHPRENFLRDPPDNKPTYSSLLENLNNSQRRAVLSIAKQCFEDNSMIHLVHGPPGCGKSKVIVHIILQMWADWNAQRPTADFPQILLCTPSNSAIDDLVNKLATCRDTLPPGVPKFEVIRVGLPQSTHENCSHLTLDYLTKREISRLKEVKEDDEERRVEIQCLEAKKHQLSQKLESLVDRRKNMDLYTKKAHEKSKEVTMMKEIRDVEKKLAETKARIKYLESGKEPDGREMAAKYKETQLELLHKANIVATTLSSCYNGIMAEAYSKRFIKFDCCIVDEATQCVEPDTLIPLMLGVRKLVLVGDPKQLPATVFTSTAKMYGLEKSLFARHYDWWAKQQREKKVVEHPCHFLNTQYRMHPEIAKWPSEYFYDNKLVSPELLAVREYKCPLEPYVVLTHMHLQNAQEAECNTEEAKIVSALVYFIINQPYCKSLSIGVITPYNRQKEELKRRINLRELPNVEIGTVDSYQGRERDVVVFSCVRTEGVGFLGGPERLNVALTRAKHSLIVVGNFMSLQGDHSWKSLLKNAKSRNLLRPILDTKHHSMLSVVISQKPRSDISFDRVNT